MKKNKAVFFGVALMVSLLSGCGKYIVRDREVYGREVTWLGKVALTQSKELRMYLGSQCSCLPGRQEWSSQTCAHTAQLILLVETRVPYHTEMMLGKSTTLPNIPVETTLCP